MKKTQSIHLKGPSESITSHTPNTAIEGWIWAPLSKDAVIYLRMNKEQIRAILPAASKSNQPVAARYCETSIIASKYKIAGGQVLIFESPGTTVL